MPRAIVNPAAGAIQAAGPALEALDRAGVERLTPAGPSEVTAMARAAADAGDDRVIVVGGDGTLHHATRGLAGRSCALAVVPVGTGNDLARAAGIALDPLAAARRALDGSPRRIDLGRCGDRPFLGVAAAGFVGDVLGWIESRRGRRTGPGIYAWGVLRCLVGFRPSTIRVEHDEGVVEGPTTIVGVANSPIFGGGMRIAPDAALDDGRLDLVVVAAMSRVRMLAAFPRIYGGSHVKLASVTCVRVRAATLSANPPLDIYGDGEALGPTDGGSRIAVWPGALSIIT